MTLRTLCAAVALLLGTSVVAQSVPDWAKSSAPAPAATDAAEDVRGPGPPPPPPPPPPVPIDGGLGLLALAGAGYAAHKLRKQRES